MNLEPVIKVEKLEKKFYYFEKDFKAIHWLINKKKFDKEFNVLKGIDFSVTKGESVAILGKNGAGKSTILKLIAEVYHPTNGTINVKGKVSSLLELGAGFNGELTGYENIYLKGTLMGMSKKEIDEIIGDIIEFADIGEYMDMPFDSYSSGMRARLGFALAVNISPDILIIDEVFAVGDRDFQVKSRAKTIEFFEMGKTILFVSHSEELVRQFCNRVIYLKDGKIAFDGAVEEGLMIYRNDSIVDSYIPRLFAQDVQVTDNEFIVNVNYGLGLGFEIKTKLNFENYEFLVEKFSDNITNHFVTEDIKLEIVDITESSFSIKIPRTSSFDWINIRCKLHDSKFCQYNYIHSVVQNGLNKKGEMYEYATSKRQILKFKNEG